MERILEEKINVLYILCHLEEYSKVEYIIGIYSNFYELEKAAFSYLQGKFKFHDKYKDLTFNGLDISFKDKDINFEVYELILNNPPETHISKLSFKNGIWI